MAAMTILDEIQTSIRQHALGAARQWWASGSGQVVFTPEIEGQ
jgi:hypothetical protein